MAIISRLIWGKISFEINKVQRSFSFWCVNTCFSIFLQEYYLVFEVNIQACKFARIKSAEFLDQIWILSMHIVCLRVRQRIRDILILLTFARA